jgi:hypothetical protein
MYLHNEMDNFDLLVRQYSQKTAPVWNGESRDYLLIADYTMPA